MYGRRQGAAESGQENALHVPIFADCQPLLGATSKLVWGCKIRITLTPKRSLEVAPGTLHHSERRLARTGILLLICAALAGGCATGRRAQRVPQTPAIWPVEHPTRRVSSGFGSRRDPIAGDSRQHNGIDIAVPKGTPVVATAGGVVIFAGRCGGYGRMVTVDHGDDLTTRYAHLKSIGVRRGKRVARGKRIGRSGQSGRTTGPHLHYEVRRQGSPIDPRPYLP